MMDTTRVSTFMGQNRLIDLQVMDKKKVKLTKRNKKLTSKADGVLHQLCTSKGTKDQSSIGSFSESQAQR
jgi:hypothetical protein